jgi:hypothetical protein
MKTLLPALLGLLVSSFAHADTIDRIDACEKNGGGACVYDILRELARKGHGDNDSNKLIKVKSFRRADCVGEVVQIAAAEIDLSGDINQQAKILCNKAYPTNGVTIYSVDVNDTCTFVSDGSSSLYQAICSQQVKEAAAK